MHFRYKLLAVLDNIWPLMPVEKDSFLKVLPPVFQAMKPSSRSSCTDIGPLPNRIGPVVVNCMSCNDGVLYVIDFPNTPSQIRPVFLDIVFDELG
jgi:hypothetical protein